MPEATPPADSGAGTGTPPAGTPPTPPEAPKPLSMTQEEFDRIIADRVRRATPADYEELKALKAEKDAAAEAQKTDLQREKDARLAAERDAKAKNAAADAKLIRASLLTEAAAQNAADSDIVVQLLLQNKDITVDDDGEVVGAKEAVKELLKNKPLLLKGKSSGPGGEFGGSDPKTRIAKIAELEARQMDTTLTIAQRRQAGAEARELKMSGALA